MVDGWWTDGDPSELKITVSETRPWTLPPHPSRQQSSARGIAEPPIPVHHARPLRVQHEVSQAGLRGDIAIEVRDLIREICRANEIESPARARAAGRCSPSPAARRPAAFGSEPRDAGDKGQDVPSPSAGPAEAARRVLGPAPVGARPFRGDQRQRDRRGYGRVHFVCNVPSPSNMRRRTFSRLLLIRLIQLTPICCGQLRAKRAACSSRSNRDAVDRPDGCGGRREVDIVDRGGLGLDPGHLACEPQCDVDVAAPGRHAIGRI